MSRGNASVNQIEVPESLQKQLHEFQQRLWKIKSAEAICGALFGLLVGFLLVFALDRFYDTPMLARLAIFVIAIAGCAYAPVFLHRWIWGNRHLEQLARLLSKRYPSLGDQMLSAIELARNEHELARSKALCAAAIRQAAGPEQQPALRHQGAEQARFCLQPVRQDGRYCGRDRLCHRHQLTGRPEGHR